jgi:hypothetical protein
MAQIELWRSEHSAVWAGSAELWDSTGYFKPPYVLNISYEC